MHKTIKIAITTVLFILFLFFLFNFKIIIVSGQSMSPSFNNGQIVLMKKSEKIERNNVVILNKDGEEFIKRVVATNGDIVEQKQGYVFINNMKTFYTTNKDCKAINLKENQFFVIGDNYKDSYDSRDYGIINNDDIQGVILFT